jgi:hypothetical protein
MIMRVPLKYFLIIGIIILAGDARVYAQHRGDNLAFQGLEMSDGIGVMALAMGGAFTANSGVLEALYNNPAGLTGIPGFQISVNAFQYSKNWRERQDYRPNRQLVTLSFILDGLYTPKPEYSGWYDYEIFLDDSTYTIQDPVLGEDPYDEESADWQKSEDAFQLYHITAAMPFRLMGRSVVASLGYFSKMPVLNYDRNQTHLVPHIGFDGYGDLPPRVTSAEDSIRMNWSDYMRERIGSMTRITAGLAFGVSERIFLGLAMHHTSGEIDESLDLSRIGYFDLVQNYQVFRFAYDTLGVNITGNSRFSSMRFDIGVIFRFNNLSLGFKVTPPYTIKREYDHTRTISDPESSDSIEESGKDEMRIPLAFSAGFSVSPVSRFRVSLDISHTPYSNADFNFAVEDTTHRGWVNQTSFGVGVEYKPIERISLMAGYRNTPQVWIPDGSGIDDRGPEAETYSLGLSVRAFMGRFDIAYLIRTLKYYDVYYSNTNWAYERYTSLMFGYTFML